jgi:hypothetical protein
MPVLFPTAYFPAVNYMAEALQADEIVIEAFETYTKQTCRNHCVIYGPNGKQTLSIPVIKTNGNHTLTKDVLVSTHQPWQKVHWRSIQTAYNNSPFFLYYQDEVAHIYEKKYKFVLDLNMAIFHILMKVLKIECPARLTEKFEKTPTGVIDLRTSLGEKHSGQNIHYPHYTQVFESAHGFLPGLSILDVIFNLGPEASLYPATLK